jgi:hypothetical protein
MHFERMPPGMFAQDQFRAAQADRFGGHDFVGLVVLEHAILVDAGFVGKCVRSDNGLVRLDAHAGVVADQFADARNLGAVDAGVQL